MAVNKVLMTDNHLVENYNVRQCMHGRHQKCKNDQSKEGDVVGPTHAVVQPSAVMVKAVHTPVARPAMLGRVHHRCFAYITFEVIICAIKLFTIFNGKPLD